MENEKTKLRRFKVTQSLRFTDTVSKVLFYIALVIELFAVMTIVWDLIRHTQKFLGVSVIFAVLGVIWLLAIRLISESRYGLCSVSFHEGGFVFRPSNANNAPEYLLRWTDCVEAGIEKTRMSFWVYASDHKLAPAERKEFPQRVNDGVFYFNYDLNAWEEFMKFVPEPFRSQLSAERDEKIK